MDGAHQEQAQQASTGTARVGGGVTVAVVPGWSSKESVTLTRADGSANVIVSLEQLTRGESLTDYVQMHGDLLSAEFPLFEQVGLEPAFVRGVREACLRQFAWTPEGGARVSQLQLYAVTGTWGLVATATTSDAQAPELRDELVEVLASVAVTRGD